MIAAGGVNPSIVRGFEIFGKIFRNEGPQFLKKNGGVIHTHLFQPKMTLFWVLSKQILAIKCSETYETYRRFSNWENIFSLL